jgi:hypothetical protein
LDFIKSQVSPIQRNGDLTNKCINDNMKKTISSICFEEQENSSIIYRTKYPTFLPDDFNANEADGLTEQSTGLLNDDVLKHVKNIANKLNINQMNLSIQLNDDETTFIR